MGQVQDTALYKLRTALTKSSGDLPSLELAFLVAAGFTTGNLDDRWRAYAAANAIPGSTSFTIRDNVVAGLP